MAAFSAGLLTTCFYEFCHCIQHLSYKPKNRMLAAMKARHMAHHFHDETCNFRITNFTWYKLFGTFYEREQRPEKGPTVFNVGTTPEVAARSHWVSRISGGRVASPTHRRRAEELRATGWGNTQIQGPGS